MVIKHSRLLYEANRNTINAMSQFMLKHESEDVSRTLHGLFDAWTEFEATDNDFAAAILVEHTRTDGTVFYSIAVTNDGIDYMADTAKRRPTVARLKQKYPNLIKLRK